MDQNLNLNVDLGKVLGQIDQLQAKVAQLEQGAQDFNQSTQAGFEATARSASDLNKDIKNTTTIIRNLEKQLRDMEKIKSTGGKIDEKAYDRVNKDIVKYKNNLGQLKGELNKVKTATAEVGTASEKAFGRLNQVLTAAAIGYAAKEMMQLAVGLDVVNAKASTVFGEYAKNLDQVAQAVAKDMGMSAMQYKKAASAIGDLLVPMKFSRKEAYVLSTGLMQLSGALSEWTGGMYSAEEVSRIFTKAMLGEREELKSLGVSITEMDVQERLAEKGQAKLTGTFLKQAQALATMELIQEKSIDAQTAFANSGESLRRQYAKLQAGFATLKGSLATELIPTFQHLFAFINNNLPLLIKLAKFIGVVTLGFVGYRKGVQMAQLITKVFNITLATTPFGAIVAAIGLLAGVFISYKMGALGANDANEQFIDSSENIAKTKATNTIEDMTAAMIDFGNGTEEAVNQVNEKLKSLDAEQLGRVREQLEAEILRVKEDIAKITQSMKVDPENSGLAEMLKVNTDGLNNLNTALEATIGKIADLNNEGPPKIDYSKMGTAELEKQLEKLSEIRDDLLTNEQKEIKKSLEFELNKRKKAADAAEKIARERAEHEKKLEEALSKAKEHIMAKDKDWREKLYAEAFESERLNTDQLIAERKRLTDKYGDLINTGDVAQNEANAKRLEYVNKELDYVLSAEDKKKQAIVSTYGDMVNMAKDAYAQTEEGQKEAMQKELELLFALKNTGVISAKEFAAAFQILNDKMSAMGQWAREHPLAAMLGLDQNELEAVQGAIDNVMSAMDNLYQQQVEDSDKMIEDLNRRIDETTGLYEAEVQLKIAGYANDADAQKKQIETLKQARDAELREKERALQKQKTLDTIKQTINLVTTASELISELGGTVIGLVIAGIAIAAMFALFATAKSQAGAATSKMEKGGPLKGPKHNRGGMRIEGTNIEVEGGEYLVNSKSAVKYEPLIHAINQDNPEAIKIALNKQYLSKPIVILKQKDIDDSRKLGKIVQLLSQGTIVVGDGFIMEKRKGYTKKVYLN